MARLEERAGLAGGKVVSVIGFVIAYKIRPAEIPGLAGLSHFILPGRTTAADLLSALAAHYEGACIPVRKGGATRLHPDTGAGTDATLDATIVVNAAGTLVAQIAQNTSNATPAGTHPERLIAACWKTGAVPGYTGLRRWAHMLGFGGHFLTKSRR